MEPVALQSQAALTVFGLARSSTQPVRVLSERIKHFRSLPLVTKSARRPPRHRHMPYASGMLHDVDHIAHMDHCKQSFGKFGRNADASMRSQAGLHVASMNGDAVVRQPKGKRHRGGVVGCRHVIAHHGDHGKGASRRWIFIYAMQNDSRANLLAAPEHRYDLPIEIDADHDCP